jgi:hypothetical protein
MGRVRIVDTEELARRDRETFQDAKSTRKVQLTARWPSELIDIGEGWGVLYFSDKWGTKDKYKHLRESNWRILVSPSFKMKFEDGDDIRKNPDATEVYEVEGEMPRHVAYLGKCLGVQGILNDGRVVHIEIPGGHWAAARSPENPDRAILIVYSDDVHIVIVGDDLGIEKDGVVG